MNCCCVCGRNITGTSWLCHKCAKDNGVEDVAYADWPDWLKMFANQEHAERRREAGPLEIPFSMCPEAEMLAYGEWD